MNKNTSSKYITALLINERFRLKGDPRMVNQWMTVREVRAANGTTVVTAEYPGGALQRFAKPSLTMVEVEPMD